MVGNCGEWRWMIVESNSGGFLESSNGWNIKAQDESFIF